jgi:chemotaxis methyl-accepting protein methylase
VSAPPSSGRVLRNALRGASKSRALRAYFGRPYLRLNTWIWSHLPASWSSKRPLRRYGSHLHGLIQLRERAQSTGTYFFRNRPELELLLRLLDQFPSHSTVDIAILGCSKGAEVYSFSYTIRSARPNLCFRLSALEIEPETLEFAKMGVYSLKSEEEASKTGSFSHDWGPDLAAKTSRDQPHLSSMFERMSPAEIEAMFEREDAWARVRPQFRENISWHIGDAGNPRLAADLGLQNIVVANRFLCHMVPDEAEACLRNLAQLVKTDGYLFVSGVDLAVRSRIASEYAWTPVLDLIEEVHEGDPSLRRGWPLEYWGLEPLDRNREDWKVRYASVFRVPGMPSRAEHSV